MELASNLLRPLAIGMGKQGERLERFLGGSVAFSSLPFWRGCRVGCRLLFYSVNLRFAKRLKIRQFLTFAPVAQLDRAWDF